MTGQETEVFNKLTEQMASLTDQVREVNILLRGGSFGQTGLVKQFETDHQRINALEEWQDDVQPAINDIKWVRGKIGYALIGAVTVWLFSGGDPSAWMQLVWGVFR